MSRSTGKVETMARKRAEGPQKKKKIMRVKREGISGFVYSAE
jgi:hypothetical protein